MLWSMYQGRWYSHLVFFELNIALSFLCTSKGKPCCIHHIFAFGNTIRSMCGIASLLLFWIISFACHLLAQWILLYCHHGVLKQLWWFHLWVTPHHCPQSRRLCVCEAIRNVAICIKSTSLWCIQLHQL
jgi:hypothetical protein